MLVNELPQCNFCSLPAVCDAPVMGIGSWAYMCREHADKCAVPNWRVIGTELKLRKKRIDGKGKTLQGIEVDIFDNDRYIECLNCGEQHHVEPDAEHTFTCDGCGACIKCPVLLYL